MTIAKYKLTYKHYSNYRVTHINTIHSETVHLLEGVTSTGLNTLTCPGGYGEDQLATYWDA